MSKYLSKFLMYTILLTSCSANNIVTPDLADTYSAAYPLKEYRIETGDQLDIKFFYNPELNEQVTVRPDGRISLPLSPEITAAGLTPAQLTESLGKSYEKVLANPRLTVMVRSFSSQRVYVDGEVNKPGMVNLAGPLTVLQSIAEAGGFKDTAKTSQVLVIRKTNGSKPVAIAVDLENVRNAASGSQDTLLAPYDIVYVPKSTIANVNQFIDQYIRKNIPIPFGISYGIGF
ncbi:MAG: sugar transporter [Deltaproteobacteria bacterium]|nr:sugar transporter [Deltaproteobacteria bacterium]